MTALDAEIVLIDFESTGVVDSYPNEPWQIGLVFFRHGKLVPECHFSSLLHVGERPFNPYAPGRHALLRGELREAPRFDSLWPQLRPWLIGRPLAAHNAATERKFLSEAFPLHPVGPWIDTLDLARIAYPDLPGHALEDLVDRLGLSERVMSICPDLRPHDAFYDAVGCGALLEHLLTLPNWQDASLENLTQAKPRRFLKNRHRGSSEATP